MFINSLNLGFILISGNFREGGTVKALLLLLKFLDSDHEYYSTCAVVHVHVCAVYIQFLL